MNTNAEGRAAHIAAIQEMMEELGTLVLQCDAPRGNGASDAATILASRDVLWLASPQLADLIRLTESGMAEGHKRKIDLTDDDEQPDRDNLPNIKVPPYVHPWQHAQHGWWLGKGCLCAACPPVYIVPAFQQVIGPSPDHPEP